MTNRILLVLFLFFNAFNGHGQEVLAISKDIIARNKVYKCVEYIFNDSLISKKDNATARYVIFDTQGRNIVENIDSDFQKNEVHHIYDRAGRESMRIFQPMSEFPKSMNDIVKVYTYKYREIGQKIVCCEYTPDSGTSKCDTLDQYYWRFDTLVNQPNKKTLISMQFRDKNLTDTLIKSFKYYNRDRLDSAKHYRYGEPTEIETVIYSYSFSNVKLSERSVTTRNNRFFISKKSHFLPTGLIDFIEIYANYSDALVISYSKKTFEYFYWK